MSPLPEGACLFLILHLHRTHSHPHKYTSFCLFGCLESPSMSSLQVNWVLALTVFITKCDLRLLISLADASPPCCAVFTWIFDAYTMSEVVILIYIFLTVRQFLSSALDSAQQKEVTCHFQADKVRSSHSYVPSTVLPAALTKEAVYPDGTALSRGCLSRLDTWVTTWGTAWNDSRLCERDECRVKFLMCSSTDLGDLITGT